MVPNAHDGSRRALVATVILALAPAGCLPLGKGETRKAEKDGQVTPASYKAPASEGPKPPGVVFAPRRTRLSVAILSRPPKDPAVDTAVWSVADELAVPEDQRGLWEANGLRVGLIRGSLPMEVTAAMNPEPPGKKVDVVEIDQPDGEPTAIDLAAPVPRVTLLLARDGRTVGKDYADARGLLRVFASRDEASPGATRLRLVPEIRHGPVQHGFGAAPTSGPFQPKEFVVKNGQAEEQLRDLAATVSIRPGQVLVVGARGDSARGLGGFLFHGTEADGDRPAQRLVLIWAQPRP
jgi:hypothetical protein